MSLALAIATLPAAPQHALLARLVAACSRAEMSASMAVSMRLMKKLATLATR